MSEQTVDALTALRRRVRFYASPPGGATARRATDALLLVPALLGLSLLIALYPPGSFERALTRFLASAPGWLDPAWAFLYDLLAFWALGLLVAAVVSRRAAPAVHSLAAVVFAFALALVSTRLALGHWPDLVHAFTGDSSAPRFPAFRVAEAGAVVLTLGPHLVRGLERAGRWILGLGLVGSLLLAPESPSGTLAAVLIAVAAATTVRLVFGTSLGRPGVGDVALALRELGVDAVRLAALQRQVSGVFSLEAADADGRTLLVKIYGRDAYDTRLLATLWRTAWYEEPGPALGLSRVQAVEREALVTLLAARAGVPSREVVVAGQTAAGDALLVLAGEARPLSTLAADELDDAMLDRWWAALGRLRDARIAHRELDPGTAALVNGDPGFVDFGVGTVTPTADQLRTDEAQLLAASAAIVGPERAVRGAVEALGAEGVGALIPYLQTAAFGDTLRHALKDARVDVDELRRKTAAAVGAEEPELVKLRRVTWGTAVQLALLVLAAAAITKVVGNVDFTQVRSDLADASWGWIVAGFVVAQLPRLTQALSTLGSVAAPLRFGPVYVLQLATSYLNLALPSSLARMAVAIRFFQRQGLPAAGAVTSGAIDSLTGNVLQALLVLALLLFSSEEVALDLSTPSSGSLSLLWIALGLLLATVLVLLLVGRIRRAIAERVRTWWPQVKEALGALRASNRLVLLLGGNLATEVLFAVALGLMARGFGSSIPLSALILINSGTSLFATFIPVPGGVGVVEFGLEVGLTSAGMTPSAALAAILLYRLSTFYLPPTWGFVAFRWLQRNRYL